MKKMMMLVFMVMSVFVFIGSGFAQPTDLGEVTLVLTPTTAGENIFTYTLQVTDMGNDHYALTGKASRPILSGAPPIQLICGYQVKTVHGNAELIDNGSKLSINLNETWGEAPVCSGVIFLFHEMNDATVRFVIPLTLTSTSYRAIVNEWKASIIDGIWTQDADSPKLVTGTAAFE